MWTDNDWAGDQENRRSCSGRCIMLGSSPLGHWSKTQSNVALSSGEAELNAAVKGVSEALGFWNFVKELFGEELQIHLKVDSSACHGMILRHGAGRVKHLCTKQLWIQEATKSYNISVD